LVMAADTATWTPPTGNSSQFGKDRPVTITANADNSIEVKPNRGVTIPDIEAIGPESEPLQQWQKRVGIDRSKQVKLVKLAHMRYQHPDLPTIRKFLIDFGMHVAKETEDEIWFRGYGTDQYVYYARKGEMKFLGGTFEVESMEELEKASKLPQAQGPIEEMKDAPGGGYLLTLQDPEGFPINLMYGQTPASTGEEWPEKVIYNYEGEDKPRVRKFNRFTPGPAAVHKLGHYGLCVQKFPEQLDWYTRTFNFAPTDFLYIPAGDGKTKDVAVFAHIDRGETCVDHHTFFMSTNPTSHVHHASFEVHDYDTQHLGHQWLGKQGYTSVWGIGRHILGSQIFDYWWDTTGNMIEHYADGDLVNQDTPVGWGPAGDESLAVWGPEVPSWFLH
ncbi:Metapyrocatechase 2, partial [Pseudocercospora fuligena]